MASNSSICRIGVFYDGSYFAYAQRYYLHERELGWLKFGPFHGLVEDFVRRTEQGFASYKVVYAAWFQAMSMAGKLSEDALRFDRNLYHDLMHAGVEPKYLPMSQSLGEKGTDVALAVDALQVGLDKKIDIAALVTGDGDFVPLARALMKQGVRVLAAYFDYSGKDGNRGFINERLRGAANYELNVSGLETSKDFQVAFKGLFRRPDEYAS
jgi:hypothetical protein